MLTNDHEHNRTRGPSQSEQHRQALGEQYSALWQEVVWLYRIWQEYTLSEKLARNALSAF